MLIIIICINREEVILNFLAKDHRLLTMLYTLGKIIVSAKDHEGQVAGRIWGNSASGVCVSLGVNPSLVFAKHRLYY